MNSIKVLALLVSTDIKVLALLVSTDIKVLAPLQIGTTKNEQTHGILLPRANTCGKLLGWWRQIYYQDWIRTPLR
jgi:hypothetical protein